MNFGAIFDLVKSVPPIEQVLPRTRLRGRSESGVGRHDPAVAASAHPASHALHTHSTWPLRPPYASLPPPMQSLRNLGTGQDRSCFMYVAAVLSLSSQPFPTTAF